MPIIDGKTMIVTMLQDHPRTADVLKKYRLDCIGCHGIKHETVERGAIAHGVDLKALLLDLNSAR